MLLQLLNFSLVLSVGVDVILIWLLLKQRARMPITLAYTLAISIFASDTLVVTYLLSDGGNESLVWRIHLVLGVALFSALHFFISNFTYSRTLPRLSRRNILIMIATVAVALLVLLDDSFAPVLSGTGSRSGGTNVSFWILPGYFALVSGLITRDIWTRYRLAENAAEVNVIRGIMVMILPITGAALLLNYVAPLLIPGQALFYIGYAVLTAVFFISAVRFQLLEIHEPVRYLLPQIAVAGFFLLIFYAFLDRPLSFATVAASIAFFLLSALIGYYLLLFFMSASEKVQLGYNEMLDQRIEEFSGEVGRFLDRQELWQYLGDFCRDTFDAPKLAVITLTYDISPYHIDHLRGFAEEDIKALISGKNGSLVEAIENGREIVNKFDYSNRSPLFRLMDELHIYLGIPLIRQNELSAIILLGGERQYIPVPRRHLHVLKVMSSQLAIAMENIRNIENIVQAQKMAGLGMLASQLAHDFRSFISLTRVHTAEDSRLSQHSLYMEKMIQDLLNYARPQELKLSPVNINDLIQMGLELVDVPAEIKVDCNFAKDLPKAMADITQMRRVFVNLIQNSIRAMRYSTGKRIKITTRVLRPVSKFTRSPWIYVEILDEGNGIPESFLERIFDPFFTTYKGEGGNGLGLAIVKQIITRHSGYIDVASRPGKGTIFNIRLPIQSDATSKPD